MDRALAALERNLGDSVVMRTTEFCECFAHDESEAEGRIPGAVVIATSREHVQATLAIAAEAGVPVTPRGAGTGRTGGAVPLCGGIVLAMTGMNRIKEIDLRDMVAVVEPGVILADLHDAVEREGAFYPPDPNSLKDCAIGGNIAENAGGPRAVKYGVTKDYVIGLDVTLMGGAQMRLGRRTAKGVVGYDLASLIVGSEGTLAVVTEATLRLVPKPQMVRTVLALFGSVHDAARVIGLLVRQAIVPRCAELVDAGALGAMRAQGVGVDERASAMLILEVDGDVASCERDLERVGEACTSAQSIDVVVAQDAAQRDRIWGARRELSPAIRRLSGNKLAEDVVVPRSKIPELIDVLERISGETGVRTLSYGHAGDGNLHVNFLWDDDAQEPRVQEAIRKLFCAVVAMRGTISGEHGIGVLKRRYVGIEQAGEVIQMQREVKRLFDPLGLLNPGKMFPES